MLVYKAKQAATAAQRELLETVQNMEDERKKLTGQFVEPEEDTKKTVDGKMEVDDEADSRETLEMRKMDITKDLRKLEGINCIAEASETSATTNCQANCGCTSISGRSGRKEDGGQGTDSNEHSRWSQYGIRQF